MSIINNYDFFIDIFKERGIVEIILDYKVSIEDREIISDYNNNWDLITKYGIKERCLGEDFIVRNIGKIDISVLVRHNNISENLINIFKHYFNQTDWDFCFLNNELSFDFIIENKLFLISNFFFNYFLMKNENNIPILKEEEIFILLNQIVDNYDKITSLDLNYFIKMLIKTQCLPSSMVNYILNFNAGFMDCFSENKKIKMRRIFQVIYFRIKTHFFNLLSTNKNVKLEYHIIEKYLDLINWKCFSRNKNIDKDMVLRFHKYLDMDYVSEHISKVDENFIKSHIKKFNIDYLSLNKNIKFSKKFILIYFSEKHIDNRIRCQKIDPTIISFMKDTLNWFNICKYQQLSNNFVLLHRDYIIWDILLENNKHISFDTIDRFINKINTDIVIKNYHLPDYFIRKYKNILNWSLISKYQNLSNKNIRKYYSRLDWSLVIEYQKNITFDDLINYSK